MDSYVSNSDTFLAGTIFLYTNSSIGIMTLKEKGKKNIGIMSCMAFISYKFPPSISVKVINTYKSELCCYILLHVISSQHNPQ